MGGEVHGTGKGKRGACTLQESPDVPGDRQGKRKYCTSTGENERARRDHILCPVMIEQDTRHQAPWPKRLNNTFRRPSQPGASEREKFCEAGDQQPRVLIKWRTGE